MIEYTMTDDEYAELMAACKPVPYLVAGGVGPSSPQENANRAWQRLGLKRGFDWTTVMPSTRPGATQRSFMANARTIDVINEQVCPHLHATKDGVHCDDCGIDVEFVDD